MDFLYDYALLKAEVDSYATSFKIGSIGKTQQKRDIPYVFMGSMNAPQVIIFGSVHAREYITTSLICMQMQLLSRSVGKIDFGVWFVPMLNVDGVELCMRGLESVIDVHIRERLLSINGQSSDFSQYKANINGVDINKNFPARWGIESGAVRVPSPTGYIGRMPASELETKASIRFMHQVKPTIVLCYHTKGEVIFWDFFLSGKQRKEHRNRAKILSLSTGYPLIGGGNSVGGLKDWAIENMGCYGYTIEVGDDKLTHPLKGESLSDIYQKNKNIFIDIGRILK